MSTSRSNIRFLRSEFIGSISAWLPSRRSTAHQRGALVMTLLGHCRSGRSTLICSWNGTYLPIGMEVGNWGCFMARLFGGCWASARGQQNLRDEEGRTSGLVAATKEEHVCRTHAQHCTA